jgi:hypothetical protein
MVGRHSECDLVIDAVVISNRHCVIFKVVLSPPSFGLFCRAE